jgi:hypothetical protein
MIPYFKECCPILDPGLQTERSIVDYRDMFGHYLPSGFAEVISISWLSWPLVTITGREPGYELAPDRRSSLPVISDSGAMGVWYPIYPNIRYGVNG